MFRIDAPIDGSRSEPFLALEPPTVGFPLRLSPSPIPLTANSPAAGRREPAIPFALALPLGSPPLPERERPVGWDQRKRPLGLIGSLILHLLPLLLLIDQTVHRSAEITPIPVQLVFQLPPPPPLAPKPAPKPKLKPETQPPDRRIASEDLGEAQIKRRDQAKSGETLPNTEPATKTGSPLEAPQQTAFLPPPPLLPAPEELTLPEPPEHTEALAPKLLRKPAPAVHEAVARMPRGAHPMPRSARFPGPAATRDEYLAYLLYLTRQHIDLLSPAVIGGRRGETGVDMLVLDDGTIAMLRVVQSSGYPDIDQRVEQIIRAVGRFPPLPQWFQGPSMMFRFHQQFP